MAVGMWRYGKFVKGLIFVVAFGAAAMSRFCDKVAIAENESLTSFDGVVNALAIAGNAYVSSPFILR